MEPPRPQDGCYRSFFYFCTGCGLSAPPPNLSYLSSTSPTFPAGRHLPTSPTCPAARHLPTSPTFPAARHHSTSPTCLAARHLWVTLCPGHVPAARHHPIVFFKIKYTRTTRPKTQTYFFRVFLSGFSYLCIYLSIYLLSIFLFIYLFIYLLSLTFFLVLVFVSIYIFYLKQK